MRELLRRVSATERMRTSVFEEAMAPVLEKTRATFDETFPRAEDVTSDLRDLLGSDNRRQVENLAKRITITKRCLAALVANAGRLGYAHAIHTFEKVPNLLTDEDRRAFFFERATNAEGAEKAGRKIANIFRQRRVYTAHVFANTTRWHVLSFSYDDAQLGRRGHWKAGAHLHYTSSVLEPGKTLAEVVAALVQPQGEVHGLHVRIDFNDET